MAGARINSLHGRSVDIAAAITIFLATVGIVESTGASIITNELNTDLHFAIYSDTLGYKTQVRKKGEKLFFTFDLALSTFWKVSMLMGFSGVYKTHQKFGVKGRVTTVV